jgi:hypothetical protein
MKEDRMAEERELGVIVASYVSSVDAKADLSGLDNVFWDGKLASYDAALLATDAWSQATISSHASRTSGDLDIGPVHDAFTVLFGGPFMSGGAVPLPADHRLRRDELLRLGNMLGPDSVIAIALVMVPDYRVDGRQIGYREAGITDVFARSDWVAAQSVDSKADHSQLASVIADLLERGSADRTARATKGNPRSGT